MKQQRILVGSRKRLFPKDIIFLKSDVNYTNIFLTNGKKLLVSTTLGIIESRLKNCGFFRTHRSTLVNLDFVESYKDHEKRGELSLLNNNKITVSRRKNKTLKMMKTKFLTLLVLSIFTLSCGKKTVDPLSSTKCETELATYEKAINAWTADPTNKTKCLAVKSSLNTIINNCNILTVAEKNKYLADLKDFDCN